MLWLVIIFRLLKIASRTIIKFIKNLLVCNNWPYHNCDTYKIKRVAIPTTSLSKGTHCNTYSVAYFSLILIRQDEVNYRELG